MGVPYLLDTDICSYFLRDRHGIPMKFREIGFENLVLSRVTVLELMVLAVRKKLGKITRKSVEELSDALTFADVDDVVWSLFPEIKARLLQAGKSLGISGDMDILQACIAVAHDLTLVSHNRRHYEAIAEQIPFPLEDWTESRQP